MEKIILILWLISTKVFTGDNICLNNSSKFYKQKDKINIEEIEISLLFPISKANNLNRCLGKLLIIKEKNKAFARESC